MRSEAVLLDAMPSGSLDGRGEQAPPIPLFAMPTSKDGRRLELQFPRISPADLESVRLVVRGVLQLWGLSRRCLVVELGVTELLTNVYKHAQGRCQLALRETAGGIAVGVSDLRPSLPVIRQSTLEQEDGRGLFLLSQMTDMLAGEQRWRGKRVWFSIRTDESV